MIDFFTRARTFYAALDPARQTQLWLGVVAVGLTVIGLWWWMTNEPYSQVVTGTPDEIGEAAAALRDAGIPSRSDGVSISVPEAQKGEALGVLHAANMGHVMGPLVSVPTGASPTIVKAALLRQKQADLASSIARISGVARAQVHIEPGKRSMFRNDDDGASASVFLELQAGAPFGREQVAAVQEMVAGAVQNVDVQDVSVADNRGRLFAGTGGGNAASKAASELLELQERYQTFLETSIERAVRPFVGHDYAMAVAVQVDLERGTVSKRQKDLDPNKAVEVETSIDELSKENNTAGTAEGAPGVDAELPERTAGNAAPGADKKEERTKSRSRLDVPSTLTSVYEPAGKLARATATVSLDEGRLKELWGEEPGSDVWTANLAQLEEAAKDAMGFDETRGDRVTFAVLPFAPVETVEAPAITVDGVTSRVAPFVPYALAAAALLLAFFFVVRPLMAKVTSAPLPRQVEVGPDGQPLLSGGGPATEEDDLASRLHQLVENFQPVDSDDLNRLVTQQSDASAQVLRQWARES